MAKPKYRVIGHGEEEFQDDTEKKRSILKFITKQTVKQIDSDSLSSSLEEPDDTILESETATTIQASLTDKSLSLMNKENSDELAKCDDSRSKFVNFQDNVEEAFDVSVPSKLDVTSKQPDISLVSETNLQLHERDITSEDLLDSTLVQDKTFDMTNYMPDSSTKETSPKHSSNHKSSLTSTSVSTLSAIQKSPSLSPTSASVITMQADATKSSRASQSIIAKDSNNSCEKNMQQTISESTSKQPIQMSKKMLTSDSRKVQLRPALSEITTKLELTPEKNHIESKVAAHISNKNSATVLTSVPTKTKTEEKKYTLETKFPVSAPKVDTEVSASDSQRHVVEAKVPLSTLQKSESEAKLPINDSEKTDAEKKAPESFLKKNNIDSTSTVCDLEQNRVEVNVPKSPNTNNFDSMTIVRSTDTIKSGIQAFVDSGNMEFTVLSVDDNLFHNRVKNYELASKL
ncbi:unnamed protein product [Thelazia callipaeda]|uniref:Flocculation protein FLO11-like n=1 Tax=Thelazia callipaeda TaxID=103827 RepID=A0A0N5D5S3_THECL|nr:unnamed protein product [Thelazia callipaeda]